MHSTEQLAALIQQKHQILTQLRDVGERQSALVASGDTSALLELLAAKQSLIMTLQHIEQGLTPYRDEDPQRRTWRSPDDRARCASLAAECNELLRQVVELERLGAERMTIRRNEVADQLQQLHASAQVRGAYEAQRAPRPTRLASVGSNTTQ